jgi:predicted outer membrane protein
MRDKAKIVRESQHLTKQLELEKRAKSAENKEFIKLQVETVIQEQRMIIHQTKKNPHTLSQLPEFDNIFYDSKLEKQKDRIGRRGKYVTDKVTNPNYQPFVPIVIKERKVKEEVVKKQKPAMTSSLKSPLSVK